MTQRTIDVFINEIYFKGPRMNYITNKTDVSHTDDTWSSALLHANGFGPEKK